MIAAIAGAALSWFVSRDVIDARFFEMQELLDTARRRADSLEAQLAGLRAELSAKDSEIQRLRTASEPTAAPASAVSREPQGNTGAPQEETHPTGASTELPPGIGGRGGAGGWNTL
jgi:hypothetical protein